MYYYLRNDLMIDVIVSIYLIGIGILGGHGANCLLQRLEHVLDVHEMVIENLFGGVQQVPDGRIPTTIEDIAAFLAPNHEVFRLQYRQLLGQVSRLDAKPLPELGDGEFALSKLIENANAQRASQGLEKLRLELEQLIGHLQARVFKALILPHKNPTSSRL